MDAEVSPPTRMLHAAEEIGRQLCEAAIWAADGRLANWLGRRDIVDDPATARFSIRTAALGPEVYAGGAGMALFLTELHRETASPGAARTAAAALRRSVHILRKGELPLPPFSFFAGHAGIACVALRLAEAAPESELGQEIRWLLDEVRRCDTPPDSPDIISGLAGAVLALCDLATRTGETAMLDRATLCGERLCSTAIWDGDACWWQPHLASGKTSPPMAAYAHGSAGISHALLVLHRLAPDPRYLAAARGGFAFGARFYNEVEGNWVDPRFPYEGGPGEASGTFQSAWCQGSAGYLIARQEAAMLDPERNEEHALHAAAAAAATRRARDARLGQRGKDATLCHGVLGLNEALVTFARATHDPGLEADCMITAADLAPRYRQLADWPSGVNAGGPNPSLMIGAAGVGYHLLRLARPSVPPILSLLAAR